MDKDTQEQIDKEEFGKKITEIREAEGFTRTAFATAIQISPETVKGVERGKYWPSGKLLKAIASHPFFRKYTLWLMCDPWDESDFDDANYPMNIKQTSPDEALLKRLQDKLEKRKNTRSG